jgi:hypothetical protein
MEIILAVLLLFGGFTLGSITADKEDDVPKTIAVGPDTDGAAGMHQVSKTIHAMDPTRCHSGRAIIYRDLTVSYQDKPEQLTSQTSECEGECPNE